MAGTMVNNQQSPCRRYGIKNNNSKYNIRYLAASVVILTTLHTSHKNGRLPILNASGISDWKKNTICIKWQTTNIECLWHHKAEEQKTIFDNGHIRNRTWKGSYNRMATSVKFFLKARDIYSKQWAGKHLLPGSLELLHQYFLAINYVKSLLKASNICEAISGLQILIL